MRILMTKFDLLMLSLLGMALASGLALGQFTQPSSAATGTTESIELYTPAELHAERANHILPDQATQKPHTEAYHPKPLPDFSTYADVNQKKQAFFDYMLPKIRVSNDRIRSIRHELLGYRDQLRLGGHLDSAASDRVADLASRYRVSRRHAVTAQLDELLIKVDVVPESLVLAQAANESGWGTSRFARQANNMFGVWCFSKGCGLEPLDRDEGLTHEVASYSSVQHSVDAYVHTINTHGAYRLLRQIRAESRAGEQHISGLALAEGLEKYSARGLEYVREIQQLIRVNNLQRYNRAISGQAV